MGQGLDQRPFAVRMEWGLRGAQAVGNGASYAVVVDVLSFTTTVSVALDQGAEVFPYPWRDESARAFARKHRAVLAIGRSEVRAAAPAATAGATATAATTTATAVTTTTTRSQPAPVSLSPASIRATAGLDRIVLPSPNGSALARAIADSVPGVQVLAACLRNRTAITTWLARQPHPPRGSGVIAVIAAGERWPDGSLRPAAEDLWGAGAIIAALDSLGLTGMSPEAQSAAAAWRAIEPVLGHALASCSSGAELAVAGFDDDVAIAAELDASKSVPVLTGLRFTDATRIA